MVFSGKPSTACLACRQRRLKCDRVRSGCSQCSRKNIQCAGYRDPSALRLRDETSRVTHKFAKLPNSKTLRYPSPNSSDSSSTKGSGDIQLVAPTSPFTELVNSLEIGLTNPLRNNLQDSSMAYFLTSYIYATPFQGYVPTLCWDNPGINDACSTAIAATALAAYSRRVRSPEILQGARNKYAEALVLVNTQLSKLETAILDRTLACVLVLGLFEAIVFEGDTAPTSWTAHTFGAMQLLRLRGPQQFKTGLSRRMFSHASNNIKTSCIQQSIPVPDDFIAFDTQFQSLYDANEPSHKLSPMINMVASIKARSLANPDTNLIHEAIQLDQQLAAFSKSALDWIKYEVHPDSESPTWAYKRVCHRYPEPRVARIWNATRLCRFFLVSFIKNAVSQENGVLMDLSTLRIPGPCKSLAEYISELKEYALTAMDQVTTDVLATVPTFMETDDWCRRRFAPSGRSLAWPLGIIEANSLSSEPARHFASEHLDMLAGDLNMPQAIHRSRFKEPLEDWLHLFHLG